MDQTHQRAPQQTPAPTTADKNGNLYGTADNGGPDYADGYQQGCGTVYRLNPNGSVTTLFSFPGGADGEGSIAPITPFRSELYAVAFGGVTGSGVVYVVTLDGSGYRVLHSFDGNGGQTPVVALQSTPYGGLFGVTSLGGPAGSVGVLYYLLPDGQFEVIHNFSAFQQGQGPNALLRDPASGNLFGSTKDGGEGHGVIYEYQPSTKTYSVLYQFTGGEDGQRPILGSIGADGTIYGTTGAGAGAYHDGTLFALSPVGGGYSFATLAAVRAYRAVTPPPPARRSPITATFSFPQPTGSEDTRTANCTMC